MTRLAQVALHSLDIGFTVALARCCVTGCVTSSGTVGVTATSNTSSSVTGLQVIEARLTMVTLLSLCVSFAMALASGYSWSRVILDEQDTQDKNQL